TGEPYDVEFRLRRADGVYRWHVGRAVPVRAQGERILRWFGTNTDMDDQIAARQRAEESERGLRALAETMPQMCWSSRPDGSVDYYNQRWLDYTGQTLEDAMSPSRRLQVHHPDHKAEVVRRWKECLVSGEPFEMEVPLLRAADGAYRLHLIRAISLRDAQGTILKWFGTCTDIHDRRELMAERLRLETKEQQMLHVAVRADVSTALSKGDDLHSMLQGACEALVKHLHVSFARLWTMDQDNALTLRASASNGADLHDEDAHLSVGELEIGRIAEQRRPHLTNDILNDERMADYAWARRGGMSAFAGYPLIVDDRVVGVVAVFADHALDASALSAIEMVAYTLAQGIVRKRAEETLDLRAAELARSNAELERFAYIASHDLQEPLRMVASYTQLLGRRYKGKLDADADEFIAFAIDGASRMQTLINDLLAFSRVGTRSGEPAPTSLKRSLDLALANLRFAIEESGAVITHDDLPTVLADERQIAQVFQNLLGNAIKFRGPEPPRIHIGVEHTDEWRIVIKDNGIGIEPRFFDRLFVLFQRLHSRVEYQGNGIGLAICKKIVERYGGRIWVEAAPGQGSTFIFTLRGSPP
ncbi:MAG: ATP-binding protein, partial [Minicystis sp.]